MLLLEKIVKSLVNSLCLRSKKKKKKKKIVKLMSFFGSYMWHITVTNLSEFIKCNMVILKKKKGDFS